jgi:hypothetical protein
MSCRVRLGHDKSYYVRLYQVKSGYFWLRMVMSG